MIIATGNTENIGASSASTGSPANVRKLPVFRPAIWIALLLSGLCIVVSCSSKRTTELSAFELLDVSPRYIPAYRVTDEIKDRAAKTLMFKDETVARALLDHHGVPFDPSMTASGYPITIFLD